MKNKIVVSLAVALLFSQVMMAQFHAGFKAGANIVKVSGKSFEKEFKYGYNLGGFAEIKLSKRWYLQPEVLFNQSTTTLDSNYKAVYQNVINSDQSKVKLNYLSIPILLDYKLLGPIHIQAGPQFSVLMSKNKNFLQNGAEAFKNGDFALAAGVQVKLDNFRISGRYLIGLNNINDIDDQDKWKSQAAQVSVGVAF